MKIKVRIRTISGKATSVEKKIRPFILGLRKPKIHQVKINKADNEILWTIEDDIRKIMKVQKNVMKFDGVMKLVLGNKLFKKKVKPEQRKELEDMLLNHTSVEIIKE